MKDSGPYRDAEASNKSRSNNPESKRHLLLWLLVMRLELAREITKASSVHQSPYTTVDFLSTLVKSTFILISEGNPGYACEHCSRNSCHQCFPTHSVLILFWSNISHIKRDVLDLWRTNKIIFASQTINVPQAFWFVPIRSVIVGLWKMCLWSRLHAAVCQLPPSLKNL